jgi:cation transport ATPase
MRLSSVKNAASAKAPQARKVPLASRLINFNDVNAGPVSWRDLNRVVFVGAAAAAFLWSRGGESNLLYATVGMICALVGGIPIFQEAYEDISNRRTKWAMFIAAAILAALLVGNVFVALVITLFGLIAGAIKTILSFRRRRTVQNSAQRPR